MTSLSPAEITASHVPGRFAGMPIRQFRTLQHEARTSQFWGGISRLLEDAAARPSIRAEYHDMAHARLVARIAELRESQTFHASERAEGRAKGRSDDHELMRHHGARLTEVSAEIDRCDAALVELRAAELPMSQAAE